MRSQGAAPTSMPEFVARLTVTLIVLAIYRVGVHLPLAGIDQTALATLYRGSGATLAVERFSVFSLGVFPIISMLLIVEVTRLASSRFRAWAGATPANSRRVDHYVLIGSLLLAAMQSYGLALALEEMGYPVYEPGPQFRLVFVTTLVAGTALLVWLAALISRHGLGSGVWILLLASYLPGLPALAVSVYEAMRSGSLTDIGLFAALAYLLVAVVAIAAAGRPLAGMALDRTLIWPLFIAALAADALTAAPLLLPAGPMRDAAAALLNRGAPLYLAALAAIVIVISLAQSRQLQARPTSALPIHLIALILAAVAVVPVLLVTWFGVPLLIDSRLIVAIVAVALAIQDQLPGQEA